MPNTVPAPASIENLNLVARRIPAAHRTFDYIFETDLSALCEEFGANVSVLDTLTDEKFFGACVVTKSGTRITILLAPHLGEYERDFFPRYLLCQALGMDLSPLPAPFGVELSPLIPGVPAS